MLLPFLMDADNIKKGGTHLHLFHAYAYEQSVGLNDNKIMFRSVSLPK